MGQQQEQEWTEAQMISVSVDLVEAAKELLQFLATIDRNRFLYEDHALEKAIYRYNAYWIPLLAQHAEKLDSEDPFVVPLDCEWIWHCHRLNPVRYKFDCEKSFGIILGNRNVISSVHGLPKSKTEEIWKQLYPEEPYELDLNKPFSGDVLQNKYINEKFTNYDLLSAVKRQISFTFQVSRPYISNDLFLQEAAARYKGFLHLIRTNKKMSLQGFCVPTYDIDLMWHTHQLYPTSYYKDMVELVGFVVQHNDSDSDRSKGGKLDLGHLETTRQWEKTFGLSYRKAGTIYKGRTPRSPTPVTLVPYKTIEDFKAFETSGKEFLFPTVHAVEVLLELVEIKNLPDIGMENIVIAFNKKQPDKFFKTKRLLGISSNYKEKCFAVFQCEPTGEFLVEVFRPPSNAPTTKSLKLLGSCSFSLEELLTSRDRLSTKKWVSIDFSSGLRNSDPALLHFSISFTPPTPAPYIFQLLRSKNSTVEKTETDVVDGDGKRVFTLRARNIMKGAGNSTIPLEKEIYYVTESGESHGLLEFHGSNWSIKGNHCSFKIQQNSMNEDSLIELVGFKMVKLFLGRRLDFELVDQEYTKSEQDFVTAIEFSTEYPYGRAVALLNSKLNTIKAIDEWVVLPAIALAYILSKFTMEGSCVENAEHIVIKKGYGSHCIAQCGKCGDSVDAMDMAKFAYGCQCVKCASCGGGLYDKKVGGNDMPQENFIMVNMQCDGSNNLSCSSECTCANCIICGGGCKSRCE